MQTASIVQSMDGGDTIDGGATMAEEPVIDFKKVGKVYQADDDVGFVIQNEMSRIHRAFDVKLNEHTEQCINTVNSGKPLIEKEPPKKK